MKSIISKILILFILFTQVVLAQEKGDVSSEDKESARIHFEAAKKLYKSEKYSEALDLFMKAYSRYPKPEILYNIGKCYEKLGDYKNAIKFYEQYLLLNPVAEDRTEVQELVKNLKEAIPKSEQTHPVHKKGDYNRIIGYSLAGAGLISLALGPVFYLKSDSIYNDVRKNHYDDKTLASKTDDIHLYDNLSIASYITGGVLIGSSIYFLYKGYISDRKSVLFIPTEEGFYIAFSGGFR